MPPKNVPKKAKTSKASAKNSPIHDFWQQLSWLKLAEFFNDRTIKRGRDYAENGNVESIWATDDGRNILAVVIGTEEYHTLVWLSEDENEESGFSLESECSCPVGNECKHGVAAIAKYLELLAKNKPIARCVRKDEETWEAFLPNGKKKTFTIDDWEDDEDDWDDDDWDDDYEDEPPRRASRSVKKIKTTANDGLVKTLTEKLQTMSSQELTSLVLLLFTESGEVQEFFERETFVELLAATKDVAKLAEQVIKLINEEFSSACYADKERYYGESSLDLNPVLAVIKQFSRFDDPLAAIDRVAKHLLMKARRYVEVTHVDDADEINGIFSGMAEVLIESKADPVKAILWVHDFAVADEYEFANDAENRIFEHAWPAKVWSRVADEMLADPTIYRDSWSLRTIVGVLDKAKRQKEATDLLREKAPQIDDFEILVHHLITLGQLDEAEKIALERRDVEFITGVNRSGFYNDPWPNYLKEIAEKRQDWPALASIQAAEFFERPCCDHLKTFLLTVKRVAGIEPAIRKSLEEFLQSGEYPSAITKSLQNEKPTPSEWKRWPLPFFSFQAKIEKPEPFFSVLCEWAMDECRADDVIKWYDECQKAKPSQHRGLSREKVADAICESHPAKAFEIYRLAAEHEMEVTRQYSQAANILRKARAALEKAKRGGEWHRVMEEIRATHRRKTNLMKELDELESLPIVQQKRKGR